MKRVWLCLAFSTFIHADETSFSFAPIYSLPSLQKSFGMQDLRFWKGTEGGLSKLLARRGVDDVLHGHVQDSSFEWDWGVRSGVKYDDPYAEWHLTATHTHFHSKPYAGSQNGREIVPLWHDLESPIGQELERSSHSSWKLDVDIADVEIGRIFAFKRFVNVTPHAGIRSTWMYQKLTIDYDQFSKGFLNQPALGNNCLALGARGGADSLWSLGKNLSFFGDGAISWLYGYHNIHERQSLVTLGGSIPPRPRINISMLECSLGLQYAKQFPRSQSSLTVKMGYEINYFFNRNRWMNGFSPMEPSVDQEKISLQGLSLGFRLDF